MAFGIDLVIIVPSVKLDPLVRLSRGCRHLVADGEGVTDRTNSGGLTGPRSGPLHPTPYPPLESNYARNNKKNGTPGGTRRLASLACRIHVCGAKMARREGLEPPTLRFEAGFAQFQKAPEIKDFAHIA